MLSSACVRSGQLAFAHTSAADQQVRIAICPSQACPVHRNSWWLTPATSAVHRRKLRHDVNRRQLSVWSSAHTERAATPVEHNGFEWATNVSRHGNVYFAIDETSQACAASMSSLSAEPTVALLFASSSYSVEFDRIIPVLRSKVPSLQHIIGCTVSAPSSSCKTVSQFVSCCIPTRGAAYTQQC